MKFTDLLTISMPCYERTDYFKEALESALNQTVKCKIIVVDNCSSHTYFEDICKEKNIQYYRNKENIGMARNFSRAFELAETKYAMNLQDDDLLLPNFVESFVNALELHPNIDVFYTDFIRINEKGEFPHHHILPFGYMENGKRVIEYGIKYKLGFPYMASIIKKDKAHTGADAMNWIGSYDWEWIYSKADKYSFYGEEKKLYKFRDHINQDTKKNSLSYILSLPFIYENILKEKVTDEKLQKKALKNAFIELIVLKSFANKKVLAELMNGTNKYSTYLKNKVNESFLLKLVYAMPQIVVTFIYKLFIKLGLFREN